MVLSFVIGFMFVTRLGNETRIPNLGAGIEVGREQTSDFEMTDSATRLNLVRR